MAARRPLDAELVRRGLASSREQARHLIDAGRVTVAGAPALKSVRLVGAGEPVVVAGDPPRHVSRAGGKLEVALEQFGVDVTDRAAIDLGSSTGGFTDCLLQRGAARVVAVDVGTNQLHEHLRGDARVEVHEQTDLRHLDAETVGGPFDVVTADLSFISLRSVLDSVLGFAGEEADLLLLVKPQFEATRAEADRGRGVIRDPAVWRRVLGEVSADIRQLGAVVCNAVVSAVPGASGNIEFVIHVRRSAPAGGGVLVDPDLDALALRAGAPTGA